MKVEIIKSKKVDFKPFKMTLSIETINDLKDLHNRFNMNHSTINEEIGNNWCERLDTEKGIYKVFNILDDELDEYFYFYEKNK